MATALELGGVECAAGGRERAWRYVMRRPLHYRPVRQKKWSTGRTRNISRTGLLFVGAPVAAVGEEIEVEINLGSGPKRRVADVVATGRIVRQAMGSAANSPTAIAIKFMECRLAPHGPRSFA